LPCELQCNFGNCSYSTCHGFQIVITIEFRVLDHPGNA
jgi:hypothetical protein